MKKYNVDTIGERPWGTLDNRTIQVKDLDQSHISNVYWHLRQREEYNHLPEQESLMNAIGHFIERKFKAILPYKPYYFKEVEYLRSYDMIHANGDIELNGQVIGNITDEELAKMELVKNHSIEIA